MSVQTPENTATGFGTCIYCPTIIADGARLCAAHMARLHGEDPRTGVGLQ